jgi:hypothetical protein
MEKECCFKKSETKLGQMYVNQETNLILEFIRCSYFVFLLTYYSHTVYENDSD